MSYAGGTGTELDPYLIATRQHLLNINLNKGSHFALIDDIDCSGGQTNRIGFTSSKLDGRGHKIYNVFYPRLNTLPATGLFDEISGGGTIKRLHLDAVSTFTGTNSACGLLTLLIDGGSVEDVLITGGMSLGGSSSLSAPFGAVFQTTADYTRCIMGATGISGDVFSALVSGATRTVTNCYRIIHSNGDNTASIPLVSANSVANEASYTGFDFVNTWVMTPIGPRLRKQGLVAVSGGPVVSGVTPADYVALVNIDDEKVYRATVAGDGTWTANVPPGNYRRTSWVNTPDCRSISEIGIIS